MKHLARFLALRLCVSSLIIGVGVVGCRATALPGAGFLDQPQLLRRA